MSYFAGRWARAHTLVLSRDSTALAVLKELADDYREDLERCRIDSYKELAMNLGIKKPATVSEAVARLSALGLVRASSIISGRCVVGTKFELVGYEKKEWPESRQGKSVWVEIALARGIEPQPWWPSVGPIQKKGVLRKTDDPQKTEVVRKTDDPTPKNGIGVLRKTDEGYAEKRNPLTGDKQGITNNDERSYARARDFSSEKTEEQPVAASAQKPTTFPHDTLPDDWRDFCEREAPDIDPQRAFDEFRDYWISVDGRKNDWTAAWRNRIRGYRNAPDWKRTPVLKRTTGRTVNPDDYLPNSTMKRQSARDYSRGWDD